ncbi:MAG: HU family DNA-binding protein [Bacteroidales bacterium]|nr:HU family DNA-binding protein [Bacteroidales bacterium]
MSVPYQLVLRHNPKDKLAPKKYYGAVKNSGKTEFETLCTTISDRGTCIKGDVQAALDGLIFAMKQGLAEGRIIQLGEFGNFRMSIGGTGVEDSKEYAVSMITRKKIIFTPGKLLQDMMKTLSFKATGIIVEPAAVTEP